jgi:type II secretory pathway pseudopilin PulG
MRKQRGFTFIGLLAAVVIMGLMLTVASRVWTTTERRERETQLLWVGDEFRMAIASYYASGHRYPGALEDLLKDERFPIPKRHLRRLYPDPMTGHADWTLVLTPDGQGITGVASISGGTPLKRAGFDLIDESFKDADCYCAWQFVYYARRVHWGTAAPAAPGSTPAAPGANPSTPDPLNPGFNPGHLSPLPPNGGLVAPGMTAPRTNDPN